MNAPERIKPKTIRLAILIALADGAIATIDDLQTRMDEPRAKVASNVHPTMAEGLIKRLRDDITHGPAYQITPKGREYLASFSGKKAEVDEKPVITPGVKVDIPDKHEPTASAIIGALAFGHQGSNEPPAGHWLTQFYQIGVEDAQKDTEIAQLQRECEDAIEKMHARANALQEWVVMAGAFGCATPQEVANRFSEVAGVLADHNYPKPIPTGYVIQCPAKPLVRFTKIEKAQARALSFARVGKRAQVLALVPVGAAVPGAEWRAA